MFSNSHVATGGLNRPGVWPRGVEELPRLPLPPLPLTRAPLLPACAQRRRLLCLQAEEARQRTLCARCCWCGYWSYRCDAHKSSVRPTWLRSSGFDQSSDGLRSLCIHRSAATLATHCLQSSLRHVASSTVCTVSRDADSAGVGAVSEEEDESDDDTPLQPHVAAGVVATGAAGAAAGNKRKASEVDAPVSDTATKPAKVCLRHCVCDADVACVRVCFGR